MEIKLNETYIMKNGEEVEITFTDGMTTWPFRGNNGHYYSKEGKRLKIDDDNSFDILEIRKKTDQEKSDNAMKCKPLSDVLLMDDFYNGVKKALIDLENLKNRCIYMPEYLGNGYENAIEKAIKDIKDHYGV